MGILNIRPSTREGAHLLIQCFGGPRSGKTLTALRLARGIAGPSGKIGVLDTEAGRARLYSDKIEGGFFVGDLTPQFAPRRYRDAIEEFVAFGADVLVIDSFSHVWQGVGGVLELADQAEANGKRGLQKWLGPKTEYRKLVSFLLSTSIHIIFCSRAKQPVVEQTVNGHKELVTLPWEPIQDKLLKYEMTVVLPMVLDGSYETDPMRLKAPGDLVHLFEGQLLTEETGAAIAQWVSGGSPINHALELLRKRANDAATDGSDAFREFWKDLDRGQRDALRGGLDNLQSIAKEADAERDRRQETAREAAEQTDPNLDAPFGDRGIEFAGATAARQAHESAAHSDGPPAGEQAHTAPGDATNTPAGTPSLEQKGDAAVGPPGVVSNGQATTPPAGVTWQQRFDALDPRQGDLVGDPYWPEYVRDAVALIGQASAADLAALRLTANTHMQALRKSDGDGYRQITEAIAARSRALDQPVT